MSKKINIIMLFLAFLSGIIGGLISNNLYLVQRAIALTESNKLRVIDFPRLDQINLDEDDHSFNIRIGDSLKSLEREIILKTLEVYQNNRQKAAKVLGITVRTLRNKLNEYREDGYNI